MREVLFKQVEQMQSRLGSVYPQFELKIIPAMTYGNPGINEVLAKLQADPQDHILLFHFSRNIRRLLPHHFMTQ